MEDSRPSRLQGAFINLMNSVTSIYQPINEAPERNEICLFIWRCIIYITSFYTCYFFNLFYSNSYKDFFINLACLIAIWFGFFLLLFRQYLPCKNPLHSIRRICYTWSCPIASSEVQENLAEDQENQTEEYAACQPTSLHNANYEQTVNQLAAQHDAGEEIAHQHAVQNRAEEQTALSVFRKYLPSRNIFGLLKNFCCSCSCDSTASTEDLRILQTEEHDANQIIARQDATEEQTPHALYATPEEVSTRLQIAEQSLLQYLLGSNEE